MRLSIVTKVVLLFTAAIAIFMATTYYQLWQTGQSTRALYEINTGYLPLSKIVAQIDSAIKNLQSDVERIANLEEREARSILSRIVFGYFPRQVNQHIAQGAAHCDKMLMVSLSDEQKNFYGEMREKLMSLKAIHVEFQEKARTLFGAMRENPSDTAEIIDELRRYERQLARQVKVMSIKMENQVARNVQMVERQASAANWSGIILSISAFFAAAMLTIVSAFLLKPIRKLTEAAQRIGQGEYRYTVEIASGDELGTLATEFESMRQSLAHRDRELKEQAKELERSNVELNTLKLHYENIIMNLWLPVLVADNHGRLRTVNPRAQQLWGDELSKRMGLPVADLPLVDKTLGDVIPIEDVLQEKSTVVREAVQVATVDGTIRRLTFTAVPLLGKDKVRGLLILGEDVTDELRMKSSMLQSERMAAVGRIAAKITHEVRNPLSSIQLNTEMLQEELEGESFDMQELRPLIHSIVREVERLHDITESYLKLGRMPKMTFGKVELNQVLTHLADFYRTEMSIHNIECRLDLSNRPVWVVADENQIVRAFHNLIKNAIEAMEHGGVLQLATRIGEDRQEVSVTDNGPGVPAAILDKIFDPFFSTKKEGTGLGLAMVQQVLAESNASIHHEAQVDGGARFVLLFPKVEDGSSLQNGPDI